MNATSEATDTPVSSFASFGEEARQDPPGDARRSERAPDSFEACDALVDELIEDDRGRHFGALARLREDRQRRATTNVEETTGRGFYATARLRLSDPAVRDARELRDASLSCEPFEDASARVTLAGRARAPASDDGSHRSSREPLPERRGSLRNRRARAWPSSKNIERARVAFVAPARRTRRRGLALARDTAGLVPDAALDTPERVKNSRGARRGLEPARARRRRPARVRAEPRAARRRAGVARLLASLSPSLGGAAGSTLTLTLALAAFDRSRRRARMRAPQPYAPQHVRVRKRKRVRSGSPRQLAGPGRLERRGRAAKLARRKRTAAARIFSTQTPRPSPPRRRACSRWAPRPRLPGTASRARRHPDLSATASPRTRCTRRSCAEAGRRRARAGTAASANSRTAATSCGR